MDEDAVEHIEIAATPASRGIIVLDLVGERYRLRKPKLHALLVTFRQMQDMPDLDLDGDVGQQMRAGSRGVKLFGDVEGWLLGLFLDNGGQRIKERLADPDDELDVPHIMDAFGQIVSKVSGRPTRSPSGSSASQPPGGRRSMDGPPPEESTPEPSTSTEHATWSGTG